MTWNQKPDALRSTVGDVSSEHHLYAKEIYLLRILRTTTAAARPLPRSVGGSASGDPVGAPVLVFPNLELGRSMGLPKVGHAIGGLLEPVLDALPVDGATLL